MARPNHHNRTRRMTGGDGIASYLGFSETKMDPEKRLSKMISDISGMMEKLQEELKGYEKDVSEKIADLRNTEQNVTQTTKAYRALEKALAELNSSTGSRTRPSGASETNISEEGNDDEGDSDSELDEIDERTGSPVYS